MEGFALISCPSYPNDYYCVEVSENQVTRPIRKYHRDVKRKSDLTIPTSAPACLPRIDNLFFITTPTIAYTTYPSRIRASDRTSSTSMPSRFLFLPRDSVSMSAFFKSANLFRFVRKCSQKSHVAPSSSLSPPPPSIASSDPDSST